MGMVPAGTAPQTEYGSVQYGAVRHLHEFHRVLANSQGHKDTAHRLNLLEMVNSLEAVTRLSRLFWWDSDLKVRVEGALRLSIVIAIMLLRGRASIFLSTQRRLQIDTMLKDGGNNTAEIYKGLLWYLGSLLALSPVDKLYWRFLRGLRQQWVQHLTRHFLENFISAQCIEPKHGEEPEKMPDQRIATDVGVFVQLFTSLGLETLQGFIHLYYNVALLRSLSPKLSKLVIIAAALGTLLTTTLGRSLRALYEAERVAEADFKYSLTRMRDNAESIAFYKGELLERKLVNKKLEVKQHTEWDRFALKDLVQATSKVYRQVVGLVPAFLLAGVTASPRGASGGGGSGGDGHSQSHGHGHGHGHGHSHGVSGGTGGGGSTLGLLSQARESFDEVHYHLLIVAENVSDFSRLSIVAKELYAYLVADDKVRARMMNPLSQNIKLSPLPLALCGLGGSSSPRPAHGAEWLRIEGLTLWTPNRSQGQKRILLQDLTCTAPMTGGLLLSGSSGVGKTTLLRAMAGLWHTGTGTVTRVMDPLQVMFLPQEPYMQLGTLREQLLYPAEASLHGEYTDRLLIQVLKRVGLSHVVERVEEGLDATRRWAEELSLGEQQRIGVARIMVHRPRYAILDEATSANDMSSEKNMYACISETCQAYVSVGHRPTIEMFHCKRLRLYGEERQGAWELESI